MSVAELPAAFPTSSDRPPVVPSARSKATFVDDPSVAKKDPTHEEWTDHYALGLIGNEKYDVREWCPNAAGRVRTGGNAGTTVVTIATLGIYAPRKVYVTCESKEMSATNTVTR